MLGHERLGAALDKALVKISDDLPRTASVLRAELRKIASELRKEGVEELLVAAVDLYGVAVATDFPTGDGVDDVFDWFRHVTYADLLDAENTLVICADLELCFANRFDPAVLAEGGPTDKVCKLITTSFNPEEVAVVSDLSPAELAAEAASLLRLSLPSVDQLADYSDTAGGARRALKRQLVTSHNGNGSHVNASNVLVFISHHELLRRTVGSSASASAA